MKVDNEIKAVVFAFGSQPLVDKIVLDHVSTVIVQLFEQLQTSQLLEIHVAVEIEDGVVPVRDGDGPGDRS